MHMYTHPRLLYILSSTSKTADMLQRLRFYLRFCSSAVTATNLQPKTHKRTSVCVIKTKLCQQLFITKLPQTASVSDYQTASALIKVAHCSPTLNQKQALSEYILSG